MYRDGELVGKAGHGRYLRRYPTIEGRLPSRVTNYTLAVIPGDGVGREVIPQGLLGATSRWRGDWSLHDPRTGIPVVVRTLPRDRPDDARRRALAGWPTPTRSISVRSGFPVYRTTFRCGVCSSPSGRVSTSTSNLRPVQVLEGIPGPLRDKGPADVDILCIRENTEGEYSGLGGRFHVGRPEESAIQTSLFTRRGVERIARYAFEQARHRRGASRERDEVECASVHRRDVGRGRG